LLPPNLRPRSAGTVGLRQPSIDPEQALEDPQHALLQSGAFGLGV
jgi:hypothetical protein